MANIITGFRIVFSILLLFFPAFSRRFTACYLLAAFTDMIDGTIARKTNTASKFGAKLDSIADFIFIGICLVKILPKINLSSWVWIWIIAIVLIKIVNIAIGVIRLKKLVVQHSILNKVTGFFLFLFPLTVKFFNPDYSSAAVCLIATISAVYEGILTNKGKEVL